MAYETERVSPFRSMTIPRSVFSSVTDMAIHQNRVAVTGCARTFKSVTFLDIFTLNDPDPALPLMTQLYSKEFDESKTGGSQYRYASFFDESHIVTVCGLHIEIHNINHKSIASVNQQRIDQRASCLTVRGKEIFVGLFDEAVVVLDFNLKQITKIVLKDFQVSPISSDSFRLHDEEYIRNITVYEDNMFLSTSHRRALKYNMNGEPLWEQIGPYPGCPPSDVTSAGDLVCFVWGGRRIDFYYPTRRKAVASFRIDKYMNEVTIVDEYRVLATTNRGIVEEYLIKMNIWSPVKENLLSMLTINDIENLANFLTLPLNELKNITESNLHPKVVVAELEKREIMSLSVFTLLTVCDGFNINMNAQQSTKAGFDTESSKHGSRSPSSLLSTTTAPDIERDEPTLPPISKYKHRRRSPSSLLSTTTASDVQADVPSVFVPSAHDTDWEPSDTTKVNSSISKKGGVIQIPNTGVKLVIPPNALTEESDIHLRVIPPDELNEPATSFSSNSSAVVEILPNHLKLNREVSLTIPHCVTFYNMDEATAKVYVSHHDKGDEPLWQEKPQTPYLFLKSKCLLRLTEFCWIKVNIDDKVVEAKNLVIYITKELLPSGRTAKVSIGYYEELPRSGKILAWNPKLVPLQKLPYIFYKDGRNPLKVFFESVTPVKSWSYSGRNPQEIPWLSVDASQEILLPFHLWKDKEFDDCFCLFRTCQGNSTSIFLDVLLEGSSSKNTRAAEDYSVSDNVIMILSNALKSEWRDVGRKLGVPETKLYQIETDNARHIREAIYHMLRYWKESNGMHATYKSLSTALIKEGRRDLGEYVQREAQSERPVLTPLEDIASDDIAPDQTPPQRGWLRSFFRLLGFRS